MCSSISQKYSSLQFSFPFQPQVFQNGTMGNQAKCGQTSLRSYLQINNRRTHFKDQIRSQQLWRISTFSCNFNCSASNAKRISSNWWSLFTYPWIYKGLGWISASFSFITAAVLWSVPGDAVTPSRRCSGCGAALVGIFSHMPSKRAWISPLLLYWKCVCMSE